MELNNIKEIKNFLNEQDFIKLKSFLFSQDIEWHFHKSQTLHGNDDEYFDHCFFNKFEITSHSFNLLKPIIEKLNCKALIQIRANLLLNKDNHYVCGFHTDYTYECKTAIFYMNNCNGFTLFENNKKVMCEENKIVLFNSQNKHAAVNQTDEKQRIVININYF
jgi:hypothetical protein